MCKFKGFECITFEVSLSFTSISIGLHNQADSTYTTDLRMANLP